MAKSKGRSDIEGFKRMMEMNRYPGLRPLLKRIRVLKRTKSKGEIEEWMVNKELKITRKLLHLEKARGGQSQGLVRKLLRQIRVEKMVSSLNEDYLSNSELALQRDPDFDLTEKWMLNKQFKLTRKLLNLEKARRGKIQGLVRKLLRQIHGEQVVSYLKKDFLSSSEMALQHFNKEKGTDFELVKLVGGFQKFCRGFWQHVNFKAKTKDSDSPKLFFAEMNCWIGGITECCILEPGAAIGCGFCDPKGAVRHPADGFQMGHYPYTMPRNLIESCPFTKKQYRRLINFKC